MNKDFRKMVLSFSELGEIIFSFAISMAVLMLLLIPTLIIDRDSLDHQWGIFVLVTPALVFVTSAIVMMLLSRKYVKKISEHYSLPTTMLLEVDSQGKVIGHSLNSNLLKSLTGGKFYEVDLGLWLDVKLKIHQEFTVEVRDSFELMIEACFVLQKVNDFKPQEVYDFLIKQAGVDNLDDYFAALLKKVLADYQGELSNLAWAYHRGEINEPRFFEEVTKIIHLQSELTNLKVSQLILEKPLKFVCV